MAGGENGNSGGLKTFPARMKVSQLEREVADMRSGRTTHHGFPVVDGDGLLVGLVSRRSLELAADGAGTSLEPHVDLSAVMDRSPITVFPRTPVSRAYTLFRKLGMRHLCVVDGRGRAVGMVTRKDLMTFRMEGGHGEGDGRETGAA
jgi:CBS domain-containing protein